MILKNLMEDKQLNFNQPLLSVRRLSSEANDKRKTDHKHPRTPPLLPVYNKSELKSGPIRNQGNVPFLWEQIPGRPKDASKTQPKAFERQPVTPKLPPGRALNRRKHEVDKKGSKDIVKYESSKEDKGSFGSEDSDEAFFDAVDTLSRTESFFMNCSVSGMSGFDGSDVKPSGGTFLTDPQTRDFMMGRFLPAAKAIASETPQLVKKKQHVQEEQPRDVNQILGRDKRQPLNSFKPKGLPHYGEKSEDEEEDDDGSEYSSAKVCGLFPRLCFKGSFCLLNPVPGIQMDAPPVSSVCRVWNDNLYENVRDVVHEEKIKLKRESDRINHKTDYQKELSRSILPKENDSHKRGPSTFRELLADEAGTESPVVEKTLRIDSVQNVKSQNSISCSLTDGKGDDLSIKSSSKLTADGKIDLESQIILKKGSDKESCRGSHSRLTLPLPKSPAESWLKRTLPTISSKNSSLRPSLAARINDKSRTLMTLAPDLKWESIVKTSNVQNGHSRFSEVMMDSIL